MSSVLDTIIRNGVIVTASGAAPADVGISGGRIVQLGGEMTAAREIDASGHFVMPGGVDVHTHLDAPGDGFNSADDFLSGTIAAACGGTTTIADFCQQRRGGRRDEAPEGRRSDAPGTASNATRHPMKLVHVTEEGERTVQDGSGGVLRGVAMFMAYKGAQMVDDRTVVRTLAQARNSGALVMVHAENGDGADFLVEQNLAAGNTSPKYHALSRPPIVEGEATNRAIALAEVAQAPLYIVHLTCRESLDAVIAGRLRGVDVNAETCTHYLYATKDDLDRPDFEGAKWVFTPPARSKEDQTLLWRALSFGTLQAVSSDHGSWSFGDHRQRGRDDFSKIPNGATGIEERMTMVYQGVVAGRFSPSRFVDLVSTTPAKLFGLYPEKGNIAVGSDADLVLWNPDATTTVTQSALHHGGDYSLYEGKQVRGLPGTVLSRGEVIVEAGRFVGEAGRGRFIKRKRYDRSRF